MIAAIPDRKIEITRGPLTGIKRCPIKLIMKDHGPVASLPEGEYSGWLLSDCLSGLTKSESERKSHNKQEEIKDIHCRSRC
jgi:hypothetical protein